MKNKSYASTKNEYIAGRALNQLSAVTFNSMLVHGGAARMSGRIVTASGKFVCCQGFTKHNM